VGVVDVLPVREAGDEELRSLLRAHDLGLGLSEARRVADILCRNPTLTELTIFNTMWSEHCSYKSSRSVLREHLPTTASNVVLGPGEDAGIVRLAEVEGVTWCLVAAHESHNHPSQVLPFEGAATGIGGVVRDVYCMGAEVMGVLDPLRFGDPRGRSGARAREIARGVVHGIWSYGNALGVPNWGGDILFDAGYDDNCLVNVVAVGMVREDRIVRSRVPKDAARAPYVVVLVGKPTDASGFGGAAFASETLEEDTDSRGAVQVPDPFLKRVVSEANKMVLELVNEAAAPIGFKDLGAGGIACALSEMAAAGGFGVELDLDSVPVAGGEYPPHVVACSETQERFALVVPARLSERILAVYNEDFDLPHVYHGARAAVVGRIVDGEGFRVRSGGSLCCDASSKAITSGITVERTSRPRSSSPQTARLPDAMDLRLDLLDLLARPNLASRAFVFEQYDSEVQGRAVLRPGEADAGVLAPFPASNVGVALSCDGLPAREGLDAYSAGAGAVAEAARNVACVGGIPWAITDCLNYGSPEDPEVFSDFVEGVRGIGDAARAIGLKDHPGEPLPVISGNVSFYNQGSGGRAIPASPIVTCLGRVPDLSRCRSLRLKAPGDALYLLLPPQGGLGAGEYARMRGIGGGRVPALDLTAQRSAVYAVIDAVAEGLVCAAHDVSLGGILAAAAEMTLGRWGGPGPGARLEIPEGVAGSLDPRDFLFSEGGSFLLEVAGGREGRFEEIAAGYGLEATRLGSVVSEPVLSVRYPGAIEVSWELEVLARPWRTGLESALAPVEAPLET
jgi:phosphoribosylformylglycinamidine synthase II